MSRPPEMPRRPPRRLLAAELGRVRTDVTGVIRALLVTSDGLPFVEDDVAAADDGHTAAITAAALALAQQVSERTTGGQLLDVIVRSTAGVVSLHAVGQGHALMVVANDEVNLAILMRAGKQAATRLSVLLEAANGRPAGRTALPERLDA